MLLNAQVMNKKMKYGFTE